MLLPALFRREDELISLGQKVVAPTEKVLDPIAAFEIGDKTGEYITAPLSKLEEPSMPKIFESDRFLIPSGALTFISGSKLIPISNRRWFNQGPQHRQLDIKQTFGLYRSTDKM